MGGRGGWEREREREGDEGREKLVAGGKEKNNKKKSTTIGRNHGRSVLLSA